jgi:phospholipid transport system substrate-binding protein
MVARRAMVPEWNYTIAMAEAKSPAVSKASRPECARKRRRLLLAAAGLPLVCATPARAQGEAGDAAVKVVHAFYDSLLGVMKQAKELGVRGRYDRLSAPIRATFDLAAMTRIAVGPDWNATPAEQQATLVEEFTRMTIATYANRFDGYAGERFEVEPSSEARPTGRIVHTRLVQSSGEPIVLNYLLRDSGAGWKIVDVYLTGTISELATRRSEFAALLKSGGPNALIESLRQKSAALMRTPAAAAAPGH